MNVLIFCVNYNSYSEANGYLQSIFSALKECKNSVSLKCVLIDNSVDPQMIDGVEGFAFEQLITNKNLGYFGGIEFGIKKHLDEINDYDYVIISNVDLIVGSSFFSRLSSLELEPDVGCVAPRIKSLKEGVDRNPKIIERYSLRKLKYLKLMYKIPLFYYCYSSLFHKKRRRKVANYSSETIYAPHGSFMIFTKASSQFISTLNYPMFLFGEEIYVAECLRSRELKTIYKKELMVVDYDHVSTGRMKNRQFFKCNFDSINWIIREYYQ